MAPTPVNWLLAILVVAVGVAVGMYLQWLYRERAPAAVNSSAKLTASLAEMVNLPRKPGEKLSDWDARVLVAHKELMSASEAFLVAAELDGSEERVGERGMLSILPVDHPAAIRYARAKAGLPPADMS